jgi:hypothetical protein
MVRHLYLLCKLKEDYHLSLSDPIFLHLNLTPKQTMDWWARNL